MNVRDIEAQAKALAPILRNYVVKAIDALRAELFSSQEDRFKSLSDALAARIEAIPAVDLDALAKQAAELIPAPDRGEDGKSVSLEDVQPLIGEAVVKEISAMPVPKDGQKGEKGDPGQSVSLDEVRKMVDQAVASVITNIELPKDGEDGRDAIEIDILPRIDSEKSYERGSWATHNGGLWRAHATTDGMRGWECVVDGLRSVTVEQLDARNFVSVQEMSSGKVCRKEMFLPTMVYRQVFKQGETYQQGDVVSFGGSLWHCNEDTDTKPGDGAKCWTLCAKKGRDGSKG